MSDNYGPANPLQPMTSRAIRRATWAAELLGLVAVPYYFTMTVVANEAGGRIVTLQLVPPPSQGPIAVVGFRTPLVGLATVRVQAGGAWLTDGAVYLVDAFEIPRRFNGTILESPILVEGGDTLNLQLDAGTGGTWATGDTVTVQALGVKAPLTNQRQLGAASREDSARWLKMLEDDGVWWAASTAITTTETAFQSVSGDIVVENVVITQRSTGVEGEVVVDNFSLLLDQHWMTPLNNNLFRGEVVPEVASLTTMLQAGLRMPMPSASRLQLQGHYPAGSVRSALRATLIGRRGGKAGACW